MLQTAGVLPIQIVAPDGSQPVRVSSVYYITPFSCIVSNASFE